MITVRKFESGDENGVWDVFYSSIHQVCSNDYSEEQIHAWAPADLDRSIWISKIQSIKPFVAVIAEKIVGYADLQKDGKIDHFFVHGDHQAEGVGSSLMKRIIEKSVNNKKLFSEVSYTAKPFYEKYGFKVTKVQQVKIHGVTLENNIMERCN